MKQDEPVNKRGDWRIAISAEVAHDVPAAYSGGPSHKAGSMLSILHYVNNRKYGRLGFITPHAAAMALSIARRSSLEALRIKDSLEFKPGPGPDGTAHLVGPLNELYNYLEHCQVSATFSFQALETYANSIICRDPNRIFQIERRGKNGKQTTVQFTSEEVERHCSIEEKLATILPDLLERPSIKGKREWQNFKHLKKVRDSIVHMKSRSIFPWGPQDQDPLYFHLFDNDPRNFPNYAFAVIWHFSQTANPRDRKPDWVLRYLELSKLK